VEHSTFFDYSSESCPGVTCRIRKITFQRRLSLLKGLRELAGRYEFTAAGDTTPDKYDAAVLQQEINKYYWHYFVQDVDGLNVDGVPAGPESVWTDGPDNLVREVLQVVVSRVFLSSDEAKN
jgi:hypothetical protein